MLLPLLLVGTIWGITNVLMKRGSLGINELPAKPGVFASLLQEIIFLVTSPLYVASFLGNMMGSVLFYYTLSHADVSLVAPTANALTFIATTAAGRVLEKEHVSLSTCKIEFLNVFWPIYE